MFEEIYRNRKVLVTGHTGFKGSWLALWLRRLGAEVVGYALPPPTEPNHFRLIAPDIDSIVGDVRDPAHLVEVFRKHQPEIVFHLAAQAIVRQSYRDPAETFAVNVMGTVHVLEAVRACGTVRAVVNVTSDKCYENREWPWGYRENDPVGGRDPYSASKGCSELLTRGWRSSFFNNDDYGKTHHTLLASARAGNVIGGGDWAADRLTPDIVRATAIKQKAQIRNPRAVRPWQHVLEPLSGYLLLGQRLLEGRKDFADAWNFGPGETGHATVETMVGLMKAAWPDIEPETPSTAGEPHEAVTLKLDCSKAREQLRWEPVWDARQAVESTVRWYRAYYASREVKSPEDLDQYQEDARSRKAVWTQS
ncbi:MAG: CDP-glucose 4,6-dehydratase [Acidobacteria bacterium]|nr:CDP-glucose 4,6-dehydratase [Acidobacteriota bacterium]